MRSTARSLVLAPLAALLVVALLLAGCGGGDDEGSGEVRIETDAGPVGLASLKKDQASGPQDERVPITANGVPTAVYAVKLDDLEGGMRVGALATVTLTKCAITDYIPNARGFTACEGTREYSFDPVQIKSRFVLTGGGDGGPDLSSTVAEVGDTTTSGCTTAIHHCTLAREGGLELSDEEASKADWLVYEVTATSPKAKCSPVTAATCNVLAVETQKGTAMYAVRVEGDPGEPGSLPADTGEDTKSLKVLINRGDKDGVRDVVYSVPLSTADDLNSLEGDQLEVASLLKASENLPQAPDVANYLVLSDSPEGIDGRYLLSDSYNPGKTGNNGENCEGKCSFNRPAVVTAILKCDIDAGRRFVNLVAAGSRADARPGESITIEDGGYLKVSRYYQSDISSDSQSVKDCNR